MGKKRTVEEYEEVVRKTFNNDLYTNCRLIKNDVIARNVDVDAVNRCRLSQYGQLHRSIQHFADSTGDATDMQKARETQKWAGEVDARSFALDQSLEEIYFNYYGEGFDGGPVIDRPGAPYFCPCGLKMMMEPKLLPPQCPTCGRLTPIGKLQRDGVLKR